MGWFRDVRSAATGLKHTASAQSTALVRDGFAAPVSSGKAGVDRLLAGLRGGNDW
ncbi:hypothetical protein SAMN06265360_103200 [Haloechinothrix alba]|uniref:Uncharacterized protein n=1 Tax=Haloechinothrix alba TaxID=664784 RepID=A0A238VRM1_9PSEU|nr:hypothetical protein SAMN06265360_103200 [Haloechinothrix alba]